MTLPQYVRLKTAKGRRYYYFDTGTVDERGRKVLSRLPDIKDPRFGDSLARAKAARTSRKNRSGVLTFDGLVSLFDRSPEFDALRPSTQRSYRLYLGAASRFFRTGTGLSAPALKIEQADVQALRDKMADTKGAANQAIRAVGALYAWAVGNHKAKENPASGIKRFKAKEHQPWPQELVEEALSDPQVGMAVALFYFTGQRINEIIRMSWADIAGGYMKVFVQKTRRHIDVAILPELADKLVRQPKVSTAILVSANGKPWSQNGLRAKLQAWAKERGHKVVPHGLRKNAVNALLEAGCTAAEVSGITDQSMGMIEHYARGVNKKALGQAAVIKLDAHRAARNKAGK